MIRLLRSVRLIGDLLKCLFFLGMLYFLVQFVYWDYQYRQNAIRWQNIEYQRKAK